MPEHLAPHLISWASILEDSTRDQAIAASRMPFIFPHLALMPDAHLGKGATVGSVIPTQGAIIPAAVGVDIGCGMIAVRTQFTVTDVENRVAGGSPLAAVRAGIEARIPVSAGKYNESIERDGTRAYIADLEVRAAGAHVPFVPDQYAANWRLQLGTLGSGNHFIEVTADETGQVWLFLHSGSRGVGNKIAQHHIKVAQKYMQRHWISLPDPDLAYLVEGTKEFSAYISELAWAQHFALLNRAEMMDRTVEAMTEYMGQAVERQETIQCHHNYTNREDHWGKSLWVSRKGAIDAHDGVPGLIPGSMGTASYIVTGKGNKLALCSSPHGAGREYSRNAARKTFTHDQLRDAMKGIEYRDTDAFIDEIPQAYKPVEQVMADASDLVEVRHVLHQLVNVKGD